MKVRIASLSFVLVCLAAVPAIADILYDNGPINGTTDAWTINFGFVVSNSFIVPGGGATVTGLAFGAWLFQGDVLQSAEVSITDSEFGGDTFFDGVVNFTQSGCVRNQFGFNVCTETGSFFDTDLAEGTYWLNLQNAILEGGDDPVYWDENSGPSQASENSVGTIPSEAFTIFQCDGCGTSTTTTTGTTVPEASSIVLFGSAILGIAGQLRRKLF